MPDPSVLNTLARCFLAGEPSIEQIILRSNQALGRSYLWVRPLARRYLQGTAGQIRLRHRDVVQFILRDPAWNQAVAEETHKVSVEHWPVEPQHMQPIAAARTWNVPTLETVGALADWLWLEYGELDWFADLKGLTYKSSDPKLRHYFYHLFPKPSGGVRLVESPKRRLKKLQREILSGNLDQVPCHPAAHGFIKGRSIGTFAAPHVGQGVVLRMDLQNFFTSIGRPRLQTFFRMMGYPESVADLLGGLCTTATPHDVCHDALHSRPHLPQGAPTSPALANICAFRIDCRLSGLAKSAGAEYTRYADDLAFSGGQAFERSAEQFALRAAAILLEEGFQVNHPKTRIMHQGVRQYLAGIVANQKVNVIRDDFDRLKAILTNCVRHGPESQNREAHPAFRSHLEGRIAFVDMINPAKAKRLRAIFEQIQWE
jgi:RNA-directed DNA polymerase